MSRPYRRTGAAGAATKIASLLFLLTITSCAPRTAVLPPEADYRKLNDTSASFNGEGKFQEALDAADRAIKAKPDYSFAWNNKSIALLGLGRIDEALVAVNRSIELRSDNALAWSNKSVILRMQLKLDEALGAVEQGLKLDPRNAMMWFNKACYLALQNRTKEARESVAQAIWLDPKLKSAAASEQDLKILHGDPVFERIIERTER